MYLIDTNVISEVRKKRKANKGVQSFFEAVQQQSEPLYLSVITLGELRRGVERIRHRGDQCQASLLDKWPNTIVTDYSNNILEFGSTEAQIWGRLRVPHYENAVDQQIAATAITYDLLCYTLSVSDSR